MQFQTMTSQTMTSQTSKTMTSLNLKQIFNKYVENCNAFNNEMNEQNFALFIDEYMGYNFKSYVLMEAIKVYLKCLAEKKVIKIDILSDNNIFKLGDLNINCFPYNLTQKHQKNIELLVKYNMIIKNGGFIEDLQSFPEKEAEKEESVNTEPEENIPPIVQNLEENNAKEEIPMAEQVGGGGSKEKDEWKYFFRTYVFIAIPIEYTEYDTFYQKFLDNLPNMNSYDISNIEVLNKNKFKIKSRYTGNFYEIEATKEGKMTCTCPDHTYRNHDCKHIKAFQKIAEKYMQSYKAEQ